MRSRRLKRYKAPEKHIRVGGKTYLFWGLYDLKSEARMAMREIKKDFQGARMVVREYHGMKHYVVYAR